MTNEERVISILSELEYNYISYDNLHGDNEQGCEIIKDALEKQIPEKMTLKKCEEKTVIACPDCGANLATAWYYEEELTGLQCQDDIPPIAKYCKFCGKKFPKDWSDTE